MEQDFSKKELEIIKEKGISLATISQQFEYYKNGMPKINLDKPALLGDGILALTENEAKNWAKSFDKKKDKLKLKKFVPASGAASRMFKFLSEFLSDFDANEESINGYINRKKDKNLPVFLVAKEKFPFYNFVLNEVKKGHNYSDKWTQDKKDYEFIKLLLSTHHFDFANKPKGVLPFHKYKKFTATAIEEHLNECTYFVTSKNESNLHFTVSEEHLQSFNEIVSAVKPKIEEKSNTKIDVSYSFQKLTTDVLVSNLENIPFRDANQNLVFRPGGHGALIENLNELEADIIFIKNIDNVIQNHIETISLYKKALAGIVLNYQEIVFNFLKSFDNDVISELYNEEIVSFLKTNLNIKVTDDFSKFTILNKIDYLKSILNRPIRVCGMVKNEGEPGGGPFWVFDNKGNSHLQIIESVQIDTKDKQQTAILNKSTHFNPVDLVCGTKNYLGEKFNLLHFTDSNTGFIVEKTKNGKPYKAYELPGLWNGAMANWLTVFVEVPLITFNPVKTVNDLLKPAHQSPN